MCEGMRVEVMSDSQRFTINILKSEISNIIRQKYKELLFFVVIELVFFAIMLWGLRGVGTLWFLLWIASYYLFNFIFFRWFFDRKPYLFTKKFFDTLLPAAKILFGVMLLLTILAYLPYVPLLFVGASDNLKSMVTEFIGDFMGDSNIYNVVISGILVLCSPFILYRPMLAWIASVIGRSGLFKNVFKRTEGYYKLFLGIFVSFYFITLGIQLVDIGLHLHNCLLWLLIAPLTVLLNLVLAKTYEFLFLD